MKKFICLTMLLAGASLMSPVMAEDDYDNGDYAAAPRAHAFSQAKQEVSKPAPVQVVDDDYDNGDYAAAPRAHKAPKAKPQAKAPKADANKVASAAPTSVKSRPIKSRLIDPFE